MYYLLTFCKRFPLRRNITMLTPSSPVQERVTPRVLIRRFNKFTEKYPLCRGILTYSIIWPFSNMCQQKITGRENVDFGEVFRFCLYGSCYVAPTLFTWLRLAANMWPMLDLRSALAKALVEQISYTPFAMISFYFVMTLLEGKGIKKAAHEVEVKFFPTYQVGGLVWPVAQVINYTLIPERNRIVFVGMCSLMWTSFLAYMKQLEAEQLAAKRLRRKLREEKLAAESGTLVFVQ